ncbi:hypothetical protein ONZ43_g3339 [Nemania bipapillata]|uniref:Uncharacterized protein n=1 Tax=Nemania bipapillata TaxID=110536 RepID=A0ACC2IX54_9PEZI|nr:hypothetical protein ONZ43_g3339 [Nemania bipapillata]
MATTIFDGSKPPTFSHLGGGHNHDVTPTPNLPPGNGSPKPSTPESKPQHYRLMTKDEWLQFCRGVGILKDEESEEVIRATSRVWPPRGFKDGLYNDVLFKKTKFTYYYHAVSVIAWGLMLTQLALSAVLTALGAMSRDNGTPITIIAAINTGIAGILALLHNSGLPDRYRWDRNEFYKLEEHIKAIVDTGLVPAEHTTNDVLGECFEMFASAQQTVEKNTPSMYTPVTSPKPPPTQVPVPARVSQKLDSKK